MSVLAASVAFKHKRGHTIVYIYSLRNMSALTPVAVHTSRFFILVFVFNIRESPDYFSVAYHDFLFWFVVENDYYTFSRHHSQSHPCFSPFCKCHSLGLSVSTYHLPSLVFLNSTIFPAVVLSPMEKVTSGLSG